MSAVLAMMRRLRTKDDARVSEYQGQRVRLSDEDLERIAGYLEKTGDVYAGYDSEKKPIVKGGTNAPR